MVQPCAITPLRHNAALLGGARNIRCYATLSDILKNILRNLRYYLWGAISWGTISWAEGWIQLETQGLPNLHVKL